MLLLTTLSTHRKAAAASKRGDLAAAVKAWDQAAALVPGPYDAKLAAARAKLAKRTAADAARRQAAQEAEEKRRAAEAERRRAAEEERQQVEAAKRGAAVAVAAEQARLAQVDLVEADSWSVCLDMSVPVLCGVLYMLQVCVCCCALSRQFDASRDLCFACRTWPACCLLSLAIP
jgi:hypothetical protein